MYHRALVIINPASGQHDPAETRALLEQHLNQEQVPFELRETQQSGDALKWAQQAETEGFDLVVA